MLRLLAAIMALLATASASSNGQYTIMYSKTIRLGSPLEISVLIPSIDEPVTLTAALRTYSWRNRGETDDVHTETKMYNNLIGLNQDTWQFNPPRSALSSDDVEYNLQINGTGGISFSNITKLTIARKTNSIFIQTDKGMYKPGQKVRFRVYQVDPDLEPLYETLTVSLKDDSDNLLWQEKDIYRSPANNMGVVKGEYQLSDQPVLGQWKIIVETASGETTEQYFEVAEFVLPKFEVEMKFDKSYHLMSEQTIKGKVCGKYTYGKDVKGKAKVEIGIAYYHSWVSRSFSYTELGTGYTNRCGGERCDYNRARREYVCTPNPPCPSTTLDVELDKGCAEIEISKWELYYLYPSINAIMKREGLTPQSPIDQLEHALRQHQNQGDINDLFNHKVLNIRANVTEEATGKTIPGEFKINFIMKELSLKFSDQMEKNFKPGLPFQAIVEVKDTEDASATPEMLKDRMGQGIPLHLKVYKVKYYYWPSWSAYRDDSAKVRGQLEEDPSWTYGGYRGTNRSLLYEWYLDIPTEAVVTRTFDIPAETNFERIELDASMNDRYGQNIEMSHSVNVHKTRTNNQLSLTKNLVPGGKDQVGSTMQFNIRSTTPFNKIYYIIMGKGQVRRQDVLTFDPARTQYSLMINLNEDFAKQISPSGRILILACVGSGDQEEMLAASLDFTVDGAMANHLNLRFAPNETKPGNEVSLMIDTEPNSYVTLLAMDQSMILLAGNENDVTKDEIMKELGQYDSAGGRSHWYWRRKRSFWCPWCYPWSRGGNDPYEVIDNAGAVVLSNCPIYRDTPDNSPYGGGFYGYGGAFNGVGAFAGGGGFASSVNRAQFFPAAPNVANMPQAAPGMVGGIPMSPSAAAPPQFKRVSRVRKEFPEAWIWTEISAGSDGTQELKVMAPDTITSWVLSGLSLNSAKGLGVSTSETKLRVFKPFFVSLDLPYHMIQGEEAKMQVTVFNYKSDTQRVKVTIKASSEYVIRKRQEDNQVIQRDETMWLDIAGDDSETIVVWLRPVVITKAMNIEVHAQSPEAADAVRRKIVVKPRGKPEEKTDSVLVIINDQQETFTHQLRVSDLLPEGSQRETRDADGNAKLVPGSEYIYVTAQGDLMGSTLDNLGSLIRMPYGCGEQNMVNFVPNIHVLRYLKAVNKQTPEMEEKAKRYMRAGYSRELTYQHTEGGFSAFGNSDTHASTWLTAFVMKSFQEAAEFITVDPMKIELTLRYLLTQQDPQGWFMEPGSTHSTYLKGGAGTGDALTAYVLVALQTVVDHLDEGSLKVQTQNAITNAQTYLQGHLQAGTYDGEDDSSYTLAIVTKALVCSSSTSQAIKNMAITKLESKAINNGGKTHWADAEKENEMSGRRRYWRNPSTDVERTAYAAMAYMCKDGTSNVGEVIPITKWLITQQGPYGGYSSTQDTVLVIGFLADFTAAYSSNSAMNMDITLKTNNNEYSFNTINSDNAVVLQKIQLDKTAEYVNVMATGTTGGIAVVQLVVKYYTEVEAPEPSVTVEVFTSMLNNNAFSLQACGKWEKDEDSAMGVVTLTLPSGYEADTSELVEMNKQIGAKRIDRNDNEINIYVDKFVAREEMCFGPLVAEQVNVVSNLQQARVLFYDYYDTDSNGYRMYLPPELKGNGLPDLVVKRPGSNFTSPGRGPNIGSNPLPGGNGNGGNGNENGGNGNRNGNNGNTRYGGTTGGSNCLATNWILTTLLVVLMGTLFLQ